MDKEQMFALASAALILANCSQAPQRPIEIKGPLVDTPQHQRYSPVKKEISLPPVPERKPEEPNTAGSDEDISKRLDEIHSNVKALDNRLRPRRDDGGEGDEK